MFKRLFLSLGLLISSASFLPHAYAQAAGATLEILPSAVQANAGDEWMVDVILKNPGLQNVISVRSWLEYDSNLLEGLSIDAEGSPFTLSAPGETEFSPEEGYVKIGRSNISGGFNQAEAKVATLHFKVKATDAVNAQLKPYDFQTTELGHMSVNIIDDGFPVNILSAEPQTVVVGLNGSAVGGEPVQSPQTDMANLARPVNLKITTGSGYVDLKWDKGSDEGLSGYNLYYGKTSGQYSRRRTLGLTDAYRLDGLNNDEVYYFAITAYDGQNKESDYSDEVAIVVNKPRSSTSPFEPYTSSKLSEVPTQPQNGPLAGWLGFSALGLGGTLAFRKKQNA